MRQERTSIQGLFKFTDDVLNGATMSSCRLNFQIPQEGFKLFKVIAI